MSPVQHSGRGLLQSCNSRKIQLAQSYDTRGRTKLHTVLWNNKLDERWALMKPNQYQITILAKVREL